MSRARFSTSQVFHWDGIPYMIQRLLADQGKVILENLATGATLQESLTTLVQAWGEGSLQFVISSAPSAEPARQPLDLASYPEHLVAIARWRLSVIAPLLDLRPRSRRDVERHVERMREEQPLDASASLDSAISVASVYRWIKNYEASGRDILALIPDTRKRGGKGESRLADEAEAMVNAVINDLYFTRSRVTIDDLHHELARRIKAENAIRMPAEQLPVPSRRTVARRVEAQDAQERFAARHGARAANREWRQYGVGPRPTHPLERVEIDHTRLDLLLFDPQDELVLGRPTITYCLDVATRFPLGIYVGFEPPSYYAVMACLQEAILPKSSLVERYGTEHEWLAYGLPQTLVVDNGPEFRGHDLDEACACLGITLDATPIAAPHYKGGVERVFRTLNTGLIHKLPGSTFSSLRDRGDYASEKHAALSLDDFYRVLMIHTVDVYAQTPHRGLGMKPADAWREATARGFVPRLPARADELPILLGRSETRLIQAYGIEWNSLRYNTGELALLRQSLKGQAARFKYNPADISRIYVHDPFEERYIEVPALAAEYATGMSLWKHEVVRAHARREWGVVDLEALGRAKHKIREVVASSVRRKKGGSRVARWGTTDTGGAKTSAAPGNTPPVIEPDDDLERALRAQAGWKVEYLEGQGQPEPNDHDSDSERKQP